MTDPATKNIIIEYIRQVLLERLRLSKLFRHNAAMKHGIPIDDETPININITSNGNGSESVTNKDDDKRSDSVLQWLEDEGEHLP